MQPNRKYKNIGISKKDKKQYRLQKEIALLENLKKMATLGKERIEFKKTLLDYGFLEKYKEVAGK